MVPLAPTATQVCPNCRATYPQGQAHHCALADPSLVQRGGLVGSTIDDRYQIVAALQSGGMGIIYKARHATLGKPLAIKILREAQDEAARQRFYQEAKSASMINHSNIVDITDFGSLPSGLPYLVMELLEGQTLGDAIHQGPMEARRACHIAAQIARGLQAVHDKGIVHRDLKPDNIFLLNREGQKDFVKIVDFGIAKVHAGPRLTQTGMTLGTPEYMAPEQATGGETDHRVDQYALGCILYEMLTGQIPFKAEEAMKLLLMHIGEAPVPLRQRRPDLSIPASLEALVLKAMAKKQKDRFPDMRALEVALLKEAGTGSERRAQATTVAMSASLDLRKKPPMWRLALLIGLCAGLLGGVVILALSRLGGPGPGRGPGTGPSTSTDTRPPKAADRPPPETPVKKTTPPPETEQPPVREAASEEPPAPPPVKRGGKKHHTARHHRRH